MLRLVTINMLRLITIKIGLYTEKKSSVKGFAERADEERNLNIEISQSTGKA